MTKSKQKKASSKASHKWTFYSSGKKERKECPKCGAGVFLGQYKNPERFHCGRCSYTEFSKQ
ncbi:30S ribosomal protein S27ae [Candidatus Woesearchaeota archaeon]|nr:30S ribosomal protein S27ae [Nanoarchaeota archaeon]MCB9370021.1 30S ribosomal protein S27ae [Candidatus Woesearchaeota archaeon]USN44554.1 MAG: 30S ribosomal protein S27ae [Candidatus Woesearchaeota archaeon]